MVRLFPRLRPRSSASSPAPTGRAPSPGALRRQLKALAKAREDRLRDLGGLMLEMYRQDRFREELLEERCAELLDLDRRLHGVESLLSAGRQGIPVSRCDCGAPVVWGSHFCANCGRPFGERAVVACAVCGHALPADASFC